MANQVVIELGTVIKNRGTYDSSVKYYKDNVVQYQNSSYIVTSVPQAIGYLQNVVPTTPNSGWSIFAYGAADVIAKTPRVDVSQSFTDVEKKQVRANIGLGNGDIDDEPTTGSENLVKSGGVQNELALGAVYDISAKNPTAGPNNDGKFTSLSALLLDANLSTLIPTSVRKGGMSIKFVQSSDNTYVQYMYMGTEVTGTPNPFLNTENWEKMNLEEEISQLGQEVKSNALNDLLRSYESVEITSDLLSTLIVNNAGSVVVSTSEYRSLILCIDPTATYKWGTSREVYGFNDYPKVGDTATLIERINTITNLSTYKYVLINLVQAGEIFTYSKNIVSVNNLPEIHNILDTEFTKTDLLTGATILLGYYNGNTGAYVANSKFSSFEISVDNFDLNKIFVEIKIGQRGTTSVPWVIFFDGDTVISTYYGNTNDKLIRQIPFGTTRIAFNLLANYTSERGDEIYMISTNTLQHVAGKITEINAQIAQLQAQGEAISQDLYGENGYSDVALELSADSYFNTAVGYEPPYTVKTSPSTWAGSRMYCGQIDVQAGDKFKIYGKGNTTGTALYAFADSSNFLLEKATNNVDYRTDGHEFTAPANAVRLVINFKEYNSVTDKLQKYGAIAQGLVERVEVLEESITSPKSVIDGKNILVFGDSLVEFKGKNDGKTWCQHAAAISSANFINVGIGGTRLSSRVPMAHIFDASKTYAVNDYVYYLTDGHYHFYKCTTQHIGAWNANDFTEVTDARMYVGMDVVNLVKMACDTNTSIEARFADADAAADCVKTNVASHDDNTAQIERLKAIDFSTVDAIIIMAGTNDFANAFGNSDSVNITEENGAINTIVAQLSTAYGTIPIYFVKEPVKWFPHTVEEETVYTDDYWCDVYTRNNMTLTEYFDKIEEQFKIINHIPVCDLYYGLGWNKQNFWNFFGIQLDGTHPYYGFRIIAEKIASFLIANKNF